MVEGGTVTRIRNNVSAIRLLKILEKEHRNPTAEEKRTLQHYVGWGGIPQVFDDGKARHARYDDPWRKDYFGFYTELKDLLTPEEWNAASVSTVNAHYTSREIIEAMWHMAEQAGFRGGQVSELGAGVGHFLGLQPEGDIRNQTRWTAVEKDEITGRILGKLYPQAHVTVDGLEHVRTRKNAQDMVIGNFPFAKEGVFDPSYPSFSLHNYFFARAADQVKPGGLVLAVTSSSTMDSPSSYSARAWLAEKTDLVSAFRLPNNAFKSNAGTEVTTDILLLRKKEGTNFQGESWLLTEPVMIPSGEGEKQYHINEYFTRHPEHMLGRMEYAGSMYRGGEPVLVPDPLKPFPETLNALIQSIPAVTPDTMEIPEENISVGPVIDRSAKPWNFIIGDNGKIYQMNEACIPVEPEWTASKTKAERTRAYVELRDHLKDTLSLMLSKPADDNEGINAAIARLNSLYDNLAAKHGPLGNSRLYSFLHEDPEFFLTAALENDIKTLVEKPNGKAKYEHSFEKAALFDGRTLYPHSFPEKAENIYDAVQISTAAKGCIDLDYIGSLTGADSRDQVQTDLLACKDIFLNPETGLPETADDYLSGNVRKKLLEAQKAENTDKAYSRNVSALLRIQPETIPFDNITISLNSGWVPSYLVEQFVKDTLEIRAEVTYDKRDSSWTVTTNKSGNSSAANSDTYGCKDFFGHELVELCLNLKTPKAFDTVKCPDGTEKQIFNQERSALAREKVNILKAAFGEWLGKQCEATKDRLEAIYNDRFNSTVRKQFTAPEWKWYPGMVQNPKMVPREHQKKVIRRIMGESTILAHGVGTGKTLIMATAAMEMRRTGLAKKPMIVVQNSTIEQFSAKFRALYPQAKLLVPTKKQRSASERNTLVSRICTGDWDAVIIPQSFFNMLPDDPEREKRYIQAEIEELREIQAEAEKEGHAGRSKVKDAAKAILKLEKRLKELADRKKDNTVTFEQLGVDALFIDEAHAYKKVPFQTKMENIKGLDKNSSQRAFSMSLKVKHVQEKTGGRNVVLATGTPITNTLTEVWNIVRTARPDIVKDYGIEHFDMFASTFADTVIGLEQTAGGTWQTVERFAKYKNVPELLEFFRNAADVVLVEQTDIDIPSHYQGKPITVAVERTEPLTEYINFLREELDRFHHMTGKEKRENSHIPLCCYTNGRKAAIDIRMVYPDMPDDPGSKLSAVVENVFREWQESTENKGTQAIFLDLYQSGDKKFNAYEEIRRKLIEKGIPEREVTVIHDANTDAKRESLFDSLQEGNIRIVMGSSATLGTGVDIQNKLVAIHHVDAPFLSGDMEQRNGRGFRQGNENAVVKEFRYGVINTLDAALYQLLATKDAMIKQVMRGDITDRNIEDAGSDISYEEQLAIYSGNPLAIEKVAVSNELKNLTMLRNSFHREQNDQKSKLARAERMLPGMQDRLVHYERRLDEFMACFKLEPAGIINGTAYNADDFPKRLDAFIRLSIDQARVDNKNEISSDSIIKKLGIIEVFGKTVKCSVYIPFRNDGRVDEKNISVFTNVMDNGISLHEGSVSSGQGFLTSVRASQGKYFSMVEELRSNIQTILKSIEEFRKNQGREFHQEERFRQLSSRLEEIERQLAAEVPENDLFKEKAEEQAETETSTEKAEEIKTTASDKATVSNIPPGNTGEHTEEWKEDRSEVVDYYGIDATPDPDRTIVTVGVTETEKTGGKIVSAATHRHTDQYTEGPGTQENQGSRPRIMK